MADQKSSSRGAVAAVVAIVLLVIVGFRRAGDVRRRRDRHARRGREQRDLETPPPGECVDPPALPEQPQQFDEVPSGDLAEDSVWTANVVTSCGQHHARAVRRQGPQTVSSFIFLAENDYWDASPCHRLVTAGIFVLQCGDPTGTGSGGPGYGYGVENAPEDFNHPRGTLAMARTSDPNTNGGQFFIVFDKTELPDPTGYSVFGRVVEGMDVVDRVAEQGVGGTLGPEAPKQPISILDVTVEKSA